VASGREGALRMPKYFFVVRQGDYVSHHSDGIELPDIGAVLMEATASTGELLRELTHPIGAGTEWRMDVADEARKPLFSLRVIGELHE
jgi:hypothetical protein